MRNLWDQQSDEPPKAYIAFRVYLLAGPGRVAGKVYPGSPYSSSDSLYALGRKYDWAERAPAWDLHNLDEEESIVKQERIKWRMKRFALLDEFNDILTGSVDNLKKRIEDGGTALSPQQIIKMFNIILQETREEFGDKGPSTQVNIDARQVKINRIEVIKDYGVKALTDGEIVEGEVDA